MESNQSFSTLAGRDFKTFAKTAKLNRNTFFIYEDGLACCEFELDDDDPAQKLTLSFIAKFYPNRFVFCVASREFVVSKACKAAFLETLVRVNANADKIGAGFTTFSYDKKVGLTATIIVSYVKRNSLETIRKAFLSLWSEVLTLYGFLSDVASGRARTRKDRIKNFHGAVSYFASFFTDATKDYIWGYEPVKKIVNYLEAEANKCSWGENRDYSHDEEGFDGFLRGRLDLRGDGFLFPHEEEDDEYAHSGPGDPFDDDENDDSSVDCAPNVDDVRCLSACFSSAVMGAAFRAKSLCRRMEDRELLERDDDFSDEFTDQDEDIED